MNTEKTILSADAATRVLAVVGFLALVTLGMWLAVYSARYVPATVGRIGAAAVALSSVFVPAPSLVVVPVASTTLPFPVASSTPTPVATPAKSAPVTPSAGTPSSGVYQIGGTSAPALSGLADLTVEITAVGYLATSSTDSFIAATTVPSGDRPAVQFTVRNVGTNTTGPWRFSATIPTSSAYIYQSLPQESLNPGDSIDYTLGFDQPRLGSETISVIVNFDHTVPESNTANDSATAQVTID